MSQKKKKKKRHGKQYAAPDFVGNSHPRGMGLLVSLVSLVLPRHFVPITVFNLYFSLKKKKKGYLCIARYKKPTSGELQKTFFCA